MIFTPKNTLTILDGRKTVTRRRLTTRHSPVFKYRVGQHYTLQPGRGKKHVAHLRIERVTFERIGTLTLRQARDEGFASASHFESAWRGMYGSYDASETVAVVEFTLAGRDSCCDIMKEVRA